MKKESVELLRELLKLICWALFVAAIMLSSFFVIPTFLDKGFIDLAFTDKWQLMTASAFTVLVMFVPLALVTMWVEATEFKFAVFIAFVAAVAAVIATFVVVPTETFAEMSLMAVAVIVLVLSLSLADMINYAKKITFFKIAIIIGEFTAIFVPILSKILKN